MKFPSCPIPFHFTESIEMAKDGIIQSSPWCTPTVRICNQGEFTFVWSFVQLYHVTKKYSYPVPRADGTQQRLAGMYVHNCVYSKLD